MRLGPTMHNSIRCFALAMSAAEALADAEHRTQLPTLPLPITTIIATACDLAELFPACQALKTTLPSRPTPQLHLSPSTFPSRHDRTRSFTQLPATIGRSPVGLNHVYSMAWYELGMCTRLNLRVLHA